MEYYELYNKLKKIFDIQRNTEVPELGIRILHNNFFSEGAKHYLPGSPHLFCQEHNLAFSPSLARACSSCPLTPNS